MPAINVAILDLKSRLETQNPNSIADLLPFPLEDTVMNVMVDNADFQQAYTAAGNKLTRCLFIKYYYEISKDTYLDEIANIFRLLPVDSLLYKNSLSKTVRQKDKPCSKFYSIEIQGDFVRLIYRTNVNDEYAAKDKSEQDYAGCEYAVFWIFRLQGERLQLFRQTAAG